MKTKSSVLLFALACAALSFDGCADYYSGYPGYGPNYGPGTPVVTVLGTLVVTVLATPCGLMYPAILRRLSGLGDSRGWRSALLVRTALAITEATRITSGKFQDMGIAKRPESVEARPLRRARILIGRSSSRPLSKPSVQPGPSGPGENALRLPGNLIDSASAEING